VCVALTNRMHGLPVPPKRNKFDRDLYIQSRLAMQTRYGLKPVVPKLPPKNHATYENLLIRARAALRSLLISSLKNNSCFFSSAGVRTSSPSGNAFVTTPADGLGDVCLSEVKNSNRNKKMQSKLLADIPDCILDSILAIGSVEDIDAMLVSFQKLKRSFANWGEVVSALQAADYTGSPVLEAERRRVLQLLREQSGLFAGEAQCKQILAGLTPALLDRLVMGSDGIHALLGRLKTLLVSGRKVASVAELEQALYNEAYLAESKRLPDPAWVSTLLTAGVAPEEAMEDSLTALSNQCITPRLLPCNIVSSIDDSRI
jgi:hypothetical protein